MSNMLDIEKEYSFTFDGYSFSNQIECKLNDTVVAIYLILYLSLQGSFKNGVVSVLYRHKTIDFTSFSGTSQDTAMTHK